MGTGEILTLRVPSDLPIDPKTAEDVGRKESLVHFHPPSVQAALSYKESLMQICGAEAEVLCPRHRPDDSDACQPGKPCTAASPS